MNNSRGVDRPVGSGDRVHSEYGPGVSGTTTFGYHPYWTVKYDGVCRIYQGWSYVTHDDTCASTPYIVNTPAVCGDAVCASTESCSSCASDCGACPAGINESGLSGGTVNRQLIVPSTATTVTISISGGTGDSDLHVKKNAAVSTSTYDCRPYKSGNAESCSFSGGGTYNILLNPYSAYTGVTLTATYAVAAPPVLPACGDAACNGSETCSSCPGDCGVCPAVCGDASCNGTETCSTCAGDCGVCPPVCGDASCNGTETCSTCAGDCGVCPPVCGDASCNGTETCSSCPGDCGACPSGINETGLSGGSVNRQLVVPTSATNASVTIRIYGGTATATSTSRRTPRCRRRATTAGRTLRATARPAPSRAAAPTTSCSARMAPTRA